VDEIARGREAVVYALDSRRVLRRDITDRPSGAAGTAGVELIEHLRRHGYPVPQVYEAHGRDVVMERIHGPDLLGYLAKDRNQVEFVFRTLGELSNLLAEVPVPEWLRELPTDHRDARLASRHVGIVHLDFHPGNVIVAADGPYVIDWTNAQAAPREVDVSLTDLILRTAPEASAYPLEFIEAGLSVFAETTGVDPGLARATACEFRLRDPGLSERERTDVEAALSQV
jgi:tRNA A-37 threonylcarbamoyl transferase component Bud32